VFAQGGFDAVIGNPPYGAELSIPQKEYYEEKYKLCNTDTAALFMEQQVRLLRNSGLSGFIVPKPFIYASNWETLRNRLLSGITKVVDVSKVWKEVLLEQVVYFYNKGGETKNYISCVRNGSTIQELTTVSKSLCIKYGFIISGVSEKEISIANKMVSAGCFLNQIALNQRGAMLQKEITKEVKEYGVLGGMQINRYSVEKETKGYVTKKQITDDKAYLKPGSIIVQNIIAHIQNPTDHVKVIATIFKCDECVILDTINQLENKSKYNSHYLLGLLNSKLLSWYIYRFIFGKAIRTMHFDAPVTSRLPFPKIDIKKQSDKALHDQLASLVKEMLTLNKTPELREKNRIKIAAVDKEIDELVYRLYGLNQEEIKLVEG
jgi:adenine-specific DNA-methyltransferase